MDTRFWIEVFGYIGSAVVIVSFMMSNVIKLRIINTIGGGLSCIYSIIVGAYPVAVLNVCLMSINIYYIWKMTHDSKVYHAVWTSPEDGSLQYFLKEFAGDIQKIWHVDVNKVKANLACIVYADGVPASVLLADKNGSKADIVLDYAFPAYRDTSAGKYVYSQLGLQGIKEVYTDLQDSEDYFKKMGFVSKDGKLEKSL